MVVAFQGRRLCCDREGNSGFIREMVHLWNAFCVILVMKAHILLPIVVLFATLAQAQPKKPEKVSLDTISNYPVKDYTPNTAFKAGEKLTFRVHYGFVDAGEAVVEIRNSPFKFEGRDAYQIVGKGYSLGGFDWFFKVRDHYETHIDRQSLMPYYFVRRCDEGGYKISQDYTFLHHKRAVKTQKGDTFATPEGIHDVISAFYYARTLDFSNAKKGDIFTITVFIDDELFPLKIKYLGKETIKIRAGKFRCMKFVPVVQEGRIWKSEDDLNVWITDDGNKIPILVKSNLMVGSIKMEVTKFEGLANPMARVN